MPGRMQIPGAAGCMVTLGCEHPMAVTEGDSGCADGNVVALQGVSSGQREEELQAGGRQQQLFRAPPDLHPGKLE